MAAVQHPLPAGVLAEVDDVVFALRARRPRRLDVDKLAAVVGVELRRRDLGETLLGLTLDDHRVVLHRSLRGARQLFVFAHELGHVFRRRGQFVNVAAADEEWFADWFARELVLPRRWLTDRWPRTKLGSLHVEAETAALQLASLGLAPALMRNGSRVLCRTCGSDPHDWSCDCRTWRRQPAAVASLPDIREVSQLYTPVRWRAGWLSIDSSTTVTPAAPRCTDGPCWPARKTPVTAEMTRALMG